MYQVDKGFDGQFTGIIKAKNVFQPPQMDIHGRDALVSCGGQRVRGTSKTISGACFATNIGSSQNWLDLTLFSEQDTVDNMFPGHQIAFSTTVMYGPGKYFIAGM